MRVRVLGSVSFYELTGAGKSNIPDEFEHESDQRLISELEENIHSFSFEQKSQLKLSLRLNSVCIESQSTKYTRMIYDDCWHLYFLCAIFGPETWFIETQILHNIYIPKDTEGRMVKDEGFNKWFNIVYILQIYV